ncbi:WXG100 family type VII secretion target [Thermocrispum municipale]|jgi:WXG100 family type VII secretion target|uniref:WXG100 family type VII secretion target n=1 Tax=Thermocrispum municipale TaxID=37926 RepID=UPI00040C7827|nr:WXG100 family type VII secretion target [Thermocrispum municipale]
MTIQVDYATLERAADEVNKAQQLMNTKLEEVEAEVKRLAASWEGEAQTAYQTAQKKQNEAQAELAQVLAQIETAILDAKQRYAQGEQGITQSFGG